ncbi:MAG: mechanosensitive ion channel family protein [Clostridia bacterium]|nr:mechanosensitive ion channel family protein [Clostridia bacterium]
MNWDSIKAFLTNAGLDLLRGLVALVVGLFLVHWVMKLFERYEQKIRIEPTLRGFIKNLIRILLYVVVIMTAVNTMGLPMTSLVTLLGSVGVAISLAMQGVLGNLIGGFILLLFKPIRVGEYVKIGDNEGTVKALGAFYTELTTFDNRHVNLPNGSLTNTPIVNFTREGTRRLDLTFSVGYESDLDRVYEILNGVVAEEKALLPEPAPSVNLLRCADSSLDFSVRVWVKTEDYWPVNFRLVERGTRALDQAGINIPYPQMDIHMK